MKTSLTSTALALSIALIGCSPKEQTLPPQAEVVQPVKLFTINNDNQIRLRQFPGKVASTKKVAISFRVSGQLINFYKTAGSTLKKGQLIAELDDSDAKNQLKDRQANFEITKLNFDRSEKLFKQSLISQAEFDTAKAKLTSAKAAYNLAQSNLSYHKVYAPYDGTIAAINADNFQVIGMNQPVVIFQKADQLDVHIQVPETLARYLNQVDQIKSEVTFASLPNTSFPITLREYATEVTKGTQSFQVTYTLTPPDNLTILPGMSANVSLSLPRDTEQTVVVPIHAVSTNDSTGKGQVWLYNPATQSVNPIEVELGEVKSNGIEIYSTLSSGDQIVSAGISELSANQKVKPLSWKRGV